MAGRQTEWDTVDRKTLGQALAGRQESLFVRGLRPFLCGRQSGQTWRIWVLLAGRGQIGSPV